MEFVKIDKKNSLKINENVFKLFKKKWSGKKFIPVSIIGKSRIGKSNFLNLMLHESFF